MKSDIHDYRDIINIKRPNFTRYKKMEIRDRAAQFAPFAALSGHKQAVDEKARRTEKRRILDDSQKEIINRKILFIKENIENKPIIYINHFVRDKKKTGGAYICEQKVVKKIDEICRYILFEDDTKICIENIYDIELI